MAGDHARQVEVQFAAACATPSPPTEPRPEWSRPDSPSERPAASRVPVRHGIAGRCRGRHRRPASEPLSRTPTTRDASSTQSDLLEQRFTSAGGPHRARSHGKVLAVTDRPAGILRRHAGGHRADRSSRRPRDHSRQHGRPSKRSHRPDRPCRFPPNRPASNPPDTSPRSRPDTYRSRQCLHRTRSNSFGADPLSSWATRWALSFNFTLHVSSPMRVIVALTDGVHTLWADWPRSLLPPASV